MKKESKIVLGEKTLRVMGKLGKALIAVALVFCVALLSARLLGKTAVSNVTDSMRQIKYVFSQSKGYPYTMEALNSKYVTNLDDEIIILYNDHAQTLNSLAVPMLSVQTVSSDTKLFASNGRALITDPKDNSVTLQSKTELLAQVKCESAVSVAALSRNGSFAVASKGDGVQSNLTVYDTKAQKVFSWNCSNERISAIALSKSGKEVAVAVIGAKNAKLYSRLIVFNVNKSAPSGEVRLDGTLLLNLYYTSAGNVIAVGDNCVRSYSPDCSLISEVSFTENTLSHTASDGSGNTVVCVSEFGGSKSRLICLGVEGELKYNISVGTDVSCVSMHGGKVAAQAGQTVSVYNKKGEVTKTVTTESAAQRIMFYGSGIYSVEKGVICKYSL